MGRSSEDNMANRRMLSKLVIDTDKFMEMPLSTQCLYFHLLLASDDDGFVASPKRIMRLLGASEDDMRLLIAKEYAYVFRSGIVVIRHWFVHNQLRTDRYTPTVWPEKSQLVLDESKVYQLVSTDADSSGNQAATSGCQPGNQYGNQTATDGCQNVTQIGNHLEPQVRLGKVSIGKVSIDKYRLGKDRGEEPATTTAPCHEILALYRSLCPALRPAKVLTSRRMMAMTVLYDLLGRNMEAVKEYFQRCADTPFLCGENRMGWVAGLDFLLKPDKYANIMTGKYDNGSDSDGGDGRLGGDGEHSGADEGEASSFAAECDAFEANQELPGEL